MLPFFSKKQVHLVRQEKKMTDNDWQKCRNQISNEHRQKLGMPSWFINQPDGSGPEGPLPHLEGAAGRDRTHRAPNEDCRYANYATYPIWRTTATWDGMERQGWAWIIPGAQGGSSQAQAFCSDPGLRPVGFHAFGQSQVPVWTSHSWLMNTIRICKKPKHEATNPYSSEFRQNLDEFRQN